MGDDPGEVYSPSSRREPERLNTGNYRIRAEDALGEGSLKQKCPFGQKMEFTRVEFKQVEFRLATGACELEIYDYPRSLRDFFNQLSRLSHRTISITPVTVDVLAWCDRISKNGGGARVSALTATNLVLSNTVSAKVRIQGSDEVRGALKSLAGSRKYEVERLVVDWSDEAGPHRVELHRDGKAQIISSDGIAALALLRTTLNSLTTEASL